MKETFKINKEDIKKFNLDGAENFWGQVVANKEGKINTWAVFWYATIFKQNGLCLNPSQSFVENIGHDSSGVHCGKSCLFTSKLSMNNNFNFKNKLKENKIAIEKIKLFYKQIKTGMFGRIKLKIKGLIK